MCFVSIFKLAFWTVHTCLTITTKCIKTVRFCWCTDATFVGCEHAFALKRCVIDRSANRSLLLRRLIISCHGGRGQIWTRSHGLSCSHLIMVFLLQKQFGFRVSIRSCSCHLCLTCFWFRKETHTSGIVSYNTDRYSTCE